MMRLLLLLLQLLLLSFVMKGQVGTPIGNDVGTVALSTKALKTIFLGNKSLWNNGKKVTVVLTSSDSENFEATAQWALGTDAFEYQKHWLSLVFQGRTNAPVLLGDEKEVIDYVSRHPGSIGLLYSIPPPTELVIDVK